MKFRGLKRAKLEGLRFAGESDQNSEWARAASIAAVGRSAKPNWAKMTPLAGGIRCANWRFGEGATNGNVECPDAIREDS